MPQHTVIQGDSLTSIAASHGLNWEVLWNDANNASLKSLRKDPHVIFPGDVIFIPVKELRIEQRNTEATHKFIRRGMPDRLQIRLMRDSTPRANLRYSLIIDGKTTNGVTDAEGWVRGWLNPSAIHAKLVLDAGTETYDIGLGHIDPIDTVSGLQGRLGNLGYFGAPVTGEMDDDTKRAISAFQLACGLSPTGDADAPTLERLEQEYGC